MPKSWRDTIAIRARPGHPGLSETGRAMNEQKRDHGKAEAILIAIAGANQVRPKTEKEKELADREKLLPAWRKWHREQLEQALAGMHRDIMHRLMAELKDLRSARELVDFITAQDWPTVDAGTRMVALHEINRAITAVRERVSPKEPINDALPGQPLTVFQMIREIITKVSLPPQEKANSGVMPG